MQNAQTRTVRTGNLGNRKSGLTGMNKNRQLCPSESGQEYTTTIAVPSTSARFDLMSPIPKAANILPGHPTPVQPRRSPAKRRDPAPFFIELKQGF